VSFSNPSCDAPGEPTFIIEQPNDPFCPVKLYCNINEFYGDLPKTGRFFHRVAPKKQIKVLGLEGVMEALKLKGSVVATAVRAKGLKETMGYWLISNKQSKYGGCDNKTS
jgi:hypothetical protein